MTQALNQHEEDSEILNSIICAVLMIPNMEIMYLKYI
jgi:hypothetical protein